MYEAAVAPLPLDATHYIIMKWVLVVFFGTNFPLVFTFPVR